VWWNETGRRDQSFEVVQYLTDPAKLDLALTGGGAPGAPGAGAPGQTPPGGGQQRPGGVPSGLPGGLPGGLGGIR